MGKSILEPDSDLHDVPCGVRYEMHVDLLPQGDISDAYLVIEE
jgi:hypothetical protein